VCVVYLALTDLQAQPVVGLVTDSEQNSVGSAGPELQCYGDIQAHPVRRHWRDTQTDRQLARQADSQTDRERDSQAAEWRMLALKQHWLLDVVSSPGLYITPPSSDNPIYILALTCVFVRLDIY